MNKNLGKFYIGFVPILLIHINSDAPVVQQFCGGGCGVMLVVLNDQIWSAKLRWEDRSVNLMVTDKNLMDHEMGLWGAH